MNQDQYSKWLYYKIYVGYISGGLEYLITETLPKICGREGIELWFFLRYSDEGGAHLRVRLKAYDSASNLREVLNPIIEEALSTLPRIPLSFYRPVISQPLVGALSRGHVIRVIESKYEPEATVFGTQGIFVAEQLFHLSSEITMTVLIDERTNLCSRKTLVPIFMAAVREAFVPTADQSFWTNYSRYWLSVNGESIDEWQPRFNGKVNELKARCVPVLMPDQSLPEKTRHAVHTWRKALSHAAAEFNALQELEHLESSTLAYSFMHLMNNRLGITPIEEAYFAALLKDESIR